MSVDREMVNHDSAKQRTNRDREEKQSRETVARPAPPLRSPDRSGGRKHQKHRNNGIQRCESHTRELDSKNGQNDERCAEQKIDDSDLRD